MKQPVNFFKINGQDFKSNGYDFYIECREPERLWVFPNIESDFENCILLTYDWVLEKFSIRLCQLGSGTYGFDVADNLKIVKNEMATMGSYVNKLKEITESYFKVLTKNK